MGRLPKIHKNWKVVVLALFVATTFWFFNALSKNYDAQVEYPLEFKFQRDSLIIVEPLPRFIQLEVAGGGWDLLRRTTTIGAKPIIIELDNPTEVKLLPKNNLQRIIADQLSDITVKYILTDSLFIDIETLQSVKMKVIIDSAFVDLEENYRITSSIIQNVDSVTFSGPVSLIRQLKSPYFVQIEEEGLDSDFEERVPIRFVNSKLIKAMPEAIEVSFSVEEFKQKTLAVPLEKINFDNAPEAILRDSVITVSFMIAESKEDDISAEEFSMIADYSLINKLDSTIAIQPFRLPEIVTDVEFIPEKVKVDYVSEK
ncbi:MAG: hypothetical protein WBA74_13590 [Cyclobacteriaceae bacterium]